MAFSQADRVSVRRWLGFAPIYQATNPRLESAMTSVQSIGDGGSLPDASTETAIKAYLAELSTIESKWKDLYEQMQAAQLDDIKIDPLRAVSGLKQLGRMYVGHISDALATAPMRDVFSPAMPGV